MCVYSCVRMPACVPSVRACELNVQNMLVEYLEGLVALGLEKEEVGPA